MLTAAMGMTVVFGLFLVVVSGVMLASPTAAIRFLERFASTRALNLLEATLLVLFGTAFVIYAGYSRFPIVLGVYGWMLIVPGLGIYLVPRRWHRRYAEWSVRLVAPHLRLLAPVSLIFGAFLIYAVV